MWKIPNTKVLQQVFVACCFFWMATAPSANPINALPLEDEMKTTLPQPIRLEDYTPPTHRIDTVDLTFELDANATVVTSTMRVRRTEAGGQSLRLDGEHQKLLSVHVDGQELSEGDYELSDESLTLLSLPDSCTVEVRSQIDPEANKALEGLYMSGNMFCTQMEPEGFRRTAYFMDRPDVMAKYTTKIIADKQKYPILLSNGNQVGGGDLDGGKHWVQWEDPFPKPSYLFALVAGDLGMIQDSYTTMSGREVDLRIYCDKGNEDRCYHAMESLKRSMQWDEQQFGLEYDLDIYMIVAVDAFNMGAMENKGLNIFNTSCVLADQTSATDVNFKRVEQVIAHEYFHNWTGNRVTCRDWFQLTLKEGLTVFRDQEYSSDVMMSRAEKRIEDVIALRSRQFLEDAGPTAHPIKPKVYLEINNFYTSTVYNKGAEVIRMIRTLISKETFRKGIDTYFELFDGQAVTTEDFVYAMEKASGRDLTQFSRWYHQAGTPELHLVFNYRPEDKEFALTVRQECPATSDQPEKEPFHIPLAVGLLGPDGQSLTVDVDGHTARGDTVVLEVTEKEQTFVFRDVQVAPVASVNRGFSAPVKLIAPYSDADLRLMMAHDSDSFNRWEAGQELTTRLMLNMVEARELGVDWQLDEAFAQAYGKVLDDVEIDLSLKALALSLPSEGVLAQRQEVIDIDGNHQVREFVANALARTHQQSFRDIYQQLEGNDAFSITPEAMGKRSLRNLCLAYMCRADMATGAKIALDQYQTANNMTDMFAAMNILADYDVPERQQVLQDFYEQWKHDTLVITKWLAVQAGSKREDTLQQLDMLEKDAVYDKTVPNLVRAVFESFIGNYAHFHKEDGSGYVRIADMILQLDKMNPLVAARMAQGFRQYKKMNAVRQEHMRQQLDRILAEEDLSKAVYEICSKCLD